MLTGLRDRVRTGLGMPEPAWPATYGQRLIVLSRRDPDIPTISLSLYATANIATHPVEATTADTFDFWRISGGPDGVCVS